MQNAVGASAKPSEPVGIAPIDVCWAEALALGFVVTANGSATPVQKAWLNSDTCTDIDTCLIAQPTLRVASAESIHGQLAVAHSSGRSSQRSRAFGLNCGCKPGGGPSCSGEDTALPRYESHQIQGSISFSDHGTFLPLQ